uniref:Malate dehydrogenase, cytoplasmic n=1 Tax=Phallusia mammillata TaxID=59560 RepID=A0A6F9DL02_9ASCI|nr:putative malate dehydrogenase 1B [Phallusia mammillata]
MAKFVIAGSCDCPYFAKLELLADQLSTNLPHFQVHKIVLPKEQWGGWLADTCNKNNWVHEKSPIVWRELVDRGGKGMLLGGFNEFMEYAQCYYGLTSEMMTELMFKIRDENIDACAEKLKEEEEFKNLSKPTHICIVNASNPVAYHLIPSVASGKIYGPDTEISVRLFDSPIRAKALEGIAMEIQDLAFPLLRKVTVCEDLNEAFKDASAVIFLDSTKDVESEETHDEYLLKNFEQFKTYAKVLDNQALPDAKIILSGNGALNFNAHVLIEHSSKLNKQNIVASSRLQERRARTLLAEKMRVIPAGVQDVVTWGNCANDAAVDSMHIELSLATVKGYDGAITGPTWFSRSLIEMIYDNKWLSTDFITDHGHRKDKLEGAFNHPTSLSEAAALSSLMRDWIQGASSPDEIFSLGVECEGWYDISGCVMSLPVKFTGGSYQVVWDMELSAESKTKLRKVEIELKRDLKVAFPSIEDDPKQAFGEDSELITAMVQQQQLSESPSKTAGDKLDVIVEEDAEEQPEAVKDDQPAKEIEA